MIVRRFSIKSQLIVTLTIMLISFVVMSMMNYSYSINALTNKVTESRLRVLGETAQNLHQLFKGIESRAQQIKFDLNVQRVLTKDFAMDGYEGYNANEQAEKVLQNITFSWEYIKSIYVVPTVVNVRSKSSTSGFINKSDMNNYSWYEQVDKEKASESWIPTRMSEENNLVKENIYMYVLPIMHLYNDRRILGHVFVNVKESSLFSILRSNDMEESEKILLLDENNRVFYDSDRVYDEETLESSILKIESVQDISGYYFIGSGKDKYLFTYTTVPDSGWKIISMVPFLAISKELEQLRRVIFTAIFLSAAVYLLVTSILYRGISKPLDAITTRIVNIGRGNFMPQEYDYNTKNEIERINYNFNWMSKRIGQLIERNSLTIAQKRDAELVALQAQIKPHFLYNTLDTINWLAISNNEKEISAMVMNLSKFYRNGLNNGREMIVIEEEIAHARAYLEIQKYSYKDRFEINFNLDSRLFKFYTIKLIIQPFLENAILHAFKDKEGKGRICVQLYREDEIIYFEVIDDGLGMDQEQIEKILSQKAEGYGVSNVNERIKLRFGDRYGVSYKSQRGIGTTAIITIPVIGPEISTNTCLEPDLKSEGESDDE